MRTFATLLLSALLPAVALAGNYTYTFSDTASGSGYNGTNGTTTTAASTLNSLAHGTAYTWGFNQQSFGASGTGASTTLSGLESAVKSGTQTITGGTLTITNIYDWISESKDVLYIDLLNNLTTGIDSQVYMPQISNDVMYGDDPFNPNSTLVSYNTYNGVTGLYANGSAGYNSLDTYYNLLNNTHGMQFQTAQTGSLLQASGLPAGDPGTWSDPIGGSGGAQTVTITLSAANIALLNSFLSSDSTSGQVLGLGLGPDCHFYDSGIVLSLTAAPVGVPDGATTLALLGVSLLSLAAFSQRRRQEA